MTEYHGWTGTLMRVDLSAHSHLIRSINKYAERFIGGQGIASRVSGHLPSRHL